MRSRARLIVLSALILLVVAGSVLSWALENNVIETTSAKQVEVSFSEGACEQPGVTIVVDFGDSADLDPILRCANDFAGNGWEVFQATAIDVSGTNQYPVEIFRRQLGILCFHKRIRLASKSGWISGKGCAVWLGGGLALHWSRATRCRIVAKTDSRNCSLRWLSALLPAQQAL